MDKDLLKLSRLNGFKDFIYLRKHKFQGKGTFREVLLFVDHDDENWIPVLKRIQKNTFKMAHGTCKVIRVPDRDGDGDDDYTIGIKVAREITKNKLVEYINSDMFPNDGDLEAILYKELEDESDDTAVANEILNARTRDTGVKSAVEETPVLDGIVTDLGLQTFIDAYHEFFHHQQPKAYLKKLMENA
ncbi:MAG: hypothetical protein AAFV80_23005, partial [Bacteroidota bacterium]